MSGASALTIATLAASCGGSGGPTLWLEAPDASVDATQTDAAAPSCLAPRTTCGATCADLRSNPLHCGACDHPCAAGEACVASKCEAQTTFAIRRMYLGDTDRALVDSDAAWRTFGTNIDGIVSTESPNGECMPFAGAKAIARTDGEDGIDNAFGRALMPLIAAFTRDPTKKAIERIGTGGRTPMISLLGYVPGTDASSVRAALVYGEAVRSQPRWDGTDVRPRAAAWTTDTGEALAAFPAATVTSGMFDSGELAGAVRINLAMGTEPVEIALHRARVRMRFTADGSGASEGVISGILATSDVAAALRDSAGLASESLCSGPIIEGAIADVRKASDIMVVGAQDPSKTCDGISLGIGFEAIRVTPGEVANRPPSSPDPCPTE